jgi:hypothetical protein
MFIAYVNGQLRAVNFLLSTGRQRFRQSHANPNDVPFAFLKTSVRFIAIIWDTSQMSRVRPRHSCPEDQRRDVDGLALRRAPGTVSSGVSRGASSC